jgi:alkylated DNA repair protein (DNA oxidative demethylase)
MSRIAAKRPRAWRRDRAAPAGSPAGTGDFFAGAADVPARETLADGAVLLRAFARAEGEELLAAVGTVTARAPFRHMVTPGGFTMSAAMTNCGRAGWITDRRGYRYDAIDPETGRPWPDLPEVFLRLARRAAAEAGYDGFTPDACLINRYEPGSRLSLHQDRNERDFAAPIVSVSLGLPAVFLFGGDRRSDRPRRYRLEHGDVAVWGGAARLAFHGIAPLADGEHPLTGRRRFNLTLRKAL